LGRCRRAVVVTADDITNEHSFPYMASAFLAAGAATSEEDVARAAVPFGKDRNGMLLGAGASGFVLESDALVRERGMVPLAELLLVRNQNSAFHGSKLDTQHIASVCRGVVDEVCATYGESREDLARKSLFISHETY